MLLILFGLVVWDGGGKVTLRVVGIEVLVLLRKTLKIGWIACIELVHIHLLELLLLLRVWVIGWKLVLIIKLIEILVGLVHRYYVNIFIYSNGKKN